MPIHKFDNCFFLHHCSTFLLKYAWRYVPWFCGWGWMLENQVGSCRWSTTPHSKCNKLTCTRIYNIQHHQYLTDNAGVFSNRPEILKCNETHEILLNVHFRRWTTVHLITYAYIPVQTCASRLGYQYWWLSGFQLDFIILRSNDLTHINSSGLLSWKALVQ